MNAPSTSPTVEKDTTSLLGNDFLTPTELARELKIHERTLARFNAARVGPPRIKIGKKVFYARKSVLHWIESLEQTPPKRYGRSAKVRKVA
jgi:Helix-turn-helix domain